MWITVGVVVAVVVLQLLRARSRPADAGAWMAMHAEKAVAFAQAAGVALDYTPESIEALETRLLEPLHLKRATGAVGDNEVRERALEFGAYIGEVLRRKYGGVWALDHAVGGPNSYPIEWRGGASFPVGWCGKRILNGDEDNVWHKYQVLLAQRDGALPALSVP
jgi:hypothetical protein